MLCYISAGRDSFLSSVRPYSMWVLVLLLLAYLTNQLDRYMLAITAGPMARDIQFGDKSCMLNTTAQISGQNLTCNGTTLEQ